MPLKLTWDGYLSPADDVGCFVVIKCLGSLLYFGAASLSSVSSGFQPSSKSGRGGVGFWAVPPGSLIVVGCLLPFRTGALHTVHSGMTGIPVWRKSEWRHLWEPQVAREPGKQKLQLSCCFLAVGSDTGLLVPVWICLLREVCFVRDSLLSWDTSKTIIIMGQADVSRPVNPDAVGE